MATSEDLAPRWDKCVVHAIKSVAVGTALGLLASTLIFKRKRWAFLLGVGYGFGVAFAGCDYEINQKEDLLSCEEEEKLKQEEEKKKKKK